MDKKIKKESNAFGTGFNNFLKNETDYPFSSYKDSLTSLHWEVGNYRVYQTCKALAKGNFQLAKKHWRFGEAHPQKYADCAYSLQHLISFAQEYPEYYHEMLDYYWEEKKALDNNKKRKRFLNRFFSILETIYINRNFLVSEDIYNISVKMYRYEE